jgi:threonine/homoserine/homoserine lactone efflux protein
VKGSFVGSAIGDILPIAVGVAISPIPIIAMVLMLSSDRGRSNGFAFLLGWLVGLLGVGIAVLLIADAAGATPDEGGGAAGWVGWFLLLLGVLAVVLGVRQWTNRPDQGTEAPRPKWMDAIDGFTAVRSALVGFVLAAVNPKNTTLTVAAAASVAAAGLSTTDSLVVLVIFVVIGTIGLAIPLVISLAMGDRATRTLADLQHWMGTHNAAIMAVLFIVIGAKLIGSGFSSITG